MSKLRIELRRALSICLAAAMASCTPRAGADHADDQIAALVLDLSIGGDTVNSREYEFAAVVSMLVAPSGTIWVVDGHDTSTPLIRQFDHSGRFLRQVGSYGAGPGEYRNPAGLAFTPDGRVVLRDYGLLNRLTFFRADGALDTTWTLPMTVQRGFRLPVAVDTGGAVWMAYTERPDAQKPDEPRVAFLRIRDRMLLDTVPLPALPEVRSDRVRVVRRLPSGGTSIRGTAPPYQPHAAWAWSPQLTFAVARTDQYRIEVIPIFGAAGSATTKTLTREVEPIPVTEEERAAAKQMLTEQVKDLGLDATRAPPIPRFKPPIKRMYFNDDGELRVSVSMPSRVRDGEWTEPDAFDLFDANGGFKGRVVLPDSFRFARMKGDTIWGVFDGPYGIESVRRYRVVWPK